LIVGLIFKEGVPDCIASLLRAGIKVWVLTGDKVETAINIGFSCRLLSKAMTLVVIQGNNVKQTIKQLTDALLKFFGISDEIGENRYSRNDYALVIDGISLKYALEDAKCKILLLELGYRCKSVLCCRVSASLKYNIIRYILLTIFYIGFSKAKGSSCRDGSQRTKRNDTCDWGWSKRCLYDSGRLITSKGYNI
jgi:hypothetical protein